MEFKITEIEDVRDTLILPLFEGANKVPNLGMNGLVRKMKIQLKSAIESDDFSGKGGKFLELWSEEQKIILIGMGPLDAVSDKVSRDIGGKVLAKLSKYHGNNITLRFTKGWKLNWMVSFVEGMMLSDYEYDEYITTKEEKKEKISLTIQASSRYQENLNSKVKDSDSISKGVYISRDLANAPPNVMYPMAYADKAIKWAKGKKNAEVQVIDWEKLQQEKMGGLINVGKGSERKPCMVIFELNKKSDSNPPVIVGKGITFDTGGISIKPSAGMEEMKLDMHGSATVFGVIHALQSIGYKEHIVGIACLAENMPSSNAYRPGDIISTYSGKTIEVFNTDAEGRKVLADGLWKAGEYNPKFIIDLATLTGAVVVALGIEGSGMWTNNDELGNMICDFGNKCDELVWQMPLWPAFEKEIKDSKVADVRDLGKSRWGGSNTAAAFLKQFLPKDSEGNEIPWAHIDIAGTSGMGGQKENSFVKHGATGVHVRTLVHMIQNLE
tara:strand:- start:380 stop:1870 length:1491 start_codon:yes stop_codon:yes gene_type:complete